MSLDGYEPETPLWATDRIGDPERAPAALAALRTRVKELEAGDPVMQASIAAALVINDHDAGVEVRHGRFSGPDA